MPPAWRPYYRLARLDRPIGVWLLLFPGWWAIGMAEVAHHGGVARTLWVMGLFWLGAVVLRAAGCVVNDIFDRDIDAMVERTAARPLASGALSVRQALFFLAGLLAVGLLVIGQFDRATVVLGLCGALLAAVYPLMKRITGWPQAWLGITFTWGAILGWSAVVGRLELPALVLYAGSFCWSMAYDTIYAHQDKLDDRKTGVGSSALSLGDSGTKPFLAAMFAGAITLTVTAGLLSGLSWLILVGIIPASLQAAWQVWALELNNPAHCLLVFRSNRLYGWLMMLAIFFGAIF